LPLKGLSGTRPRTPSYRASVPVGTWCPSWRLHPTELLSLRDMVLIVAVNPTELASLRDMVLIVAVTSYQAVVPVGTWCPSWRLILPSLCPCGTWCSSWRLHPTKLVSLSGHEDRRG